MDPTPDMIRELGVSHRYVANSEFARRNVTLENGTNSFKVIAKATDLD